MITDAYLSAITVTNVYQSCTYKMAAKIKWHRYETKLRHCHPMFSEHVSRRFYTVCILLTVNTKRQLYSRSDYPHERAYMKQPSQCACPL